MRVLWAAAIFQLRLTVRAPDTIQVCATAPLFTVIFMAITQHAGRGDLTPYATVAPMLMSVWTMALFTAGNVITQERNQGTLEGLVASPAPLAALIAARLTAVTLVSLLTFAEAVLVAGLGFGHWVTARHPALFAVSLVATALGMAGTASILSPLFVLAPSARIIQNTISYPLYLIGGALVPVQDLPSWIRPVSHLIFLSWSADLLRDSLQAQKVASAALRLTVLVLLGALGYLVGYLLFGRLMRRVRRLGTLARV